jgi:hypothetical protein
MFLYYYIYKLCNYYLSFYHNCKSKIFFIQDIKTTDENIISILNLKLYFFYFVNCLVNIMPIKTKLFLENKFNNYDNNKLITVKFSNGKINRNIIYKNISSYKLSKNIKLNYSDKNFFDENELIMNRKYIILDIFYKDISDNIISIKNIIENYVDKNKNYDENKIKNILLLENIDKNKIYIAYLQNMKRQEKEFDLEIMDYHICDFYNF